MKPCRSWNNDFLSRVLRRCSHALTPFWIPLLTRRRTRQHSRRALFPIGDIVGQRRLRQLIDHDHLDRVVLGHVVADPHALRAAFAPIHCHIGGPILESLIPSHLFAVQNGVGFRAILRAELAALGGTDFYVDIGYEIHGAPLCAYALAVATGSSTRLASLDAQP